jgi:hypothetical protein
MTTHGRAALRVALLFSILLPLACREGTNSPVTPGSFSFPFVLSQGNSYGYDAIMVDEWGFYLPSTRSRAVQRVTSVNGTLDGFSGVVTIADSTVLLRDSIATIQLISLAQTTTGDLYRYGFLAELARLSHKPPIRPTWDRIAAISEGPGSSWLVGYLDSAQQQAVHGSLGDAAESYIATVNGVQTVLQDYRVEFSGEGIEYIFRISSSPPAFLQYVLVPGDTTQGAVFSLTDMQVASQ